MYDCNACVYGKLDLFKFFIHTLKWCLLVFNAFNLTIVVYPIKQCSSWICYDVKFDFSPLPWYRNLQNYLEKAAVSQDFYIHCYRCTQSINNWDLTIPRNPWNPRNHTTLFNICKVHLNTSYKIIWWPWNKSLNWFGMN